MDFLILSLVFSEEKLISLLIKNKLNKLQLTHVKTILKNITINSNKKPNYKKKENRKLKKRKNKNNKNKLNKEKKLSKKHKLKNNKFPKNPLLSATKINNKKNNKITNLHLKAMVEELKNISGHKLYK